MKNRKHIGAVLVLALGIMLAFCLSGCIQIQQPAQDQSTDTQTEQPVTDTAAPAADDTAAAPAAPATDANGDYIGEDKALEIALADAGLTNDQVSNTFVQLDFDDDLGKDEYEVKFYQGTTEYDYDIDAVTGDITDKDIDRDGD